MKLAGKIAATIGVALLPAAWWGLTLLMERQEKLWWPSLPGNLFMDGILALTLLAGICAVVGMFVHVLIEIWKESP